MHPDVVQETPGRCPECGMELLKGSRPKSHETHDKHSGHSAQKFLRKFWASLLLTIPVLFASELAQRLHLNLPPFPGQEWLVALMASGVFFYGGGVFLAGAARELRGRQPGMMTLIGLAIATAYLYSVAVTFTGTGAPLFWELTTLITIMLLGHWLEMRSVRGAQGALRELSRLLPDSAEVVRGGVASKIQLSDLRVNDLVRVRPGAKVPADGVVTDGASDINEALLTGESAPVAKSVGSSVIAGSLNGSGVLTVRVTEIGEKTFLAGIVRLVAEAQASKSRLQVLSDRAARVLTGVAVVGGLLTFLAWLLAGGGLAVAIERFVAVLVVACPHALGLAVPLVAAISTTKGARHGLLVRQRLALEAARTVDTVLFDKTGTLTKGEFGVERSWVSPGNSAERVLALAASLEAQSEHVMGRAIVKEALRRGVTLPAATAVSALPGQGIRGMVNGEEVVVGSTDVLRADEHAAREVFADASAKGHSVVFVVARGAVIGAFALGDQVREESREAVRALRARGIRVAMVTGDTEEVARWVAEDLSVDEWRARVRPEGKAAFVRELQLAGRRVAFVGDGLNDAPALAQADVGIAIGAGTNVAIESAGLLLVRNDPRDVGRAITLSHATYRKMLQNLFWAAGYNVVAIPLAAGVASYRGILLSPALAAVFMSFSTIIVAVNALLLRRLRF